MDENQEIAITFLVERIGKEVTYSWGISGDPPLESLPKNVDGFRAIVAALTPALLVLCNHIDPSVAEQSDVKIDTPNYNS